MAKARKRRAKKRQKFPKRAGAKHKPSKKVRTLKVGKGVDIWKVQDALRGDGFFARAVARDKVATNAPIATPI